MDNDKGGLGKNVKRVSFQECSSTPIRPLRKMPSFPILATETLFSDNSLNLSHVPSSSPIKHQDGPQTFSSFINDPSSSQKTEPPTLENLRGRVESSSVISKLLKDSLITSNDSSFSDFSPIRHSSPKSYEDDKTNETKARGDCKYYFWLLCISWYVCMHDLHVKGIHIRSPRNNVDSVNQLSLSRADKQMNKRKKSLKTEKKSWRSKSISLFISLVKNVNFSFPRLVFFCYFLLSQLEPKYFLKIMWIIIKGGVTKKQQQKYKQYSQ